MSEQVDETAAKERNCGLTGVSITHTFSAVSMRATLEVINQIQATGVIGRYAIGGAIGATFYLEPVATFDIDIFVSFGNNPGTALVSLEPIYSYLSARGYKPEGEHLMIEGWQVQFLPADDSLHHEALLEAVQTGYEGIKTWVMSAEHLMAIALKTGRGKDFLRIEQFVEEGSFDADKLERVLTRHGLTERWRDFARKYLGGSND